MMDWIFKVELALISTIHKFEKVTPLKGSDFVLMKSLLKHTTYHIDLKLFAC